MQRKFLVPGSSMKHVAFLTGERAPKTCLHFLPKRLCQRLIVESSSQFACVIANCVNPKTFRRVELGKVKIHKMMTDMAAVVAAAANSRGIGVNGNLVGSQSSPFLLQGAVMCVRYILLTYILFHSLGAYLATWPISNVPRWSLRRQRKSMRLSWGARLGNQSHPSFVHSKEGRM